MDEYIFIPQSISWMHWKFMNLRHECIAIHEKRWMNTFHSSINFMNAPKIAAPPLYSWIWYLNAMSFIKWMDEYISLLNQFHEECTENCGAAALFMNSRHECIAIHEINGWIHFHSSINFMNALKIDILLLLVVLMINLPPNTNFKWEENEVVFQHYCLVDC